MPISQILYIAFDTNIWISFSIGKRLDKLKDIFFNEKFVIFICPEIIEEFIRIAQSDKLAKYISVQRLIDTLVLIDDFTVRKQIRSKVKLSRDPKDDFLLAFSKENKLDYLVTGDKDLLIIKKFQSTHIVTFNEFLTVNPF
jgi:putative PIN family toxin of toxin-antitoxin system